MSRKRVKKKKIFPVIGIGLILVLIGVIGGYAIAAEDNEVELVPPSVTVKDEDIENATLAIGSHLIYIGSMTDELYEIASDSASKFSQQEIYYKSELSGGTWYEISAATSIADISTSGTPISKSVIESLRFTHHTKSDGHTYDLVTEESVSMFDISDPYDIDAMEELRPVVVQYQMLKDKSKKNNIDKVNIAYLERFFSRDLKSIETIEQTEEKFPNDIKIEREPNKKIKELDKGLASLQKYYDSLDPNGSDMDKRDITASVMAKMDASRRLIALTKLYDLLTELENDIMESQSKANGDDASVDVDLSEAIIEALDNVQASILKLTAKASSDGSSIIEEEESKLINQIIEAAKPEISDDDSEEENPDDDSYFDRAACDALIEKIADLYNIRDNVTENEERELAYLNDTLIPAAEKAFKDALLSGVSSEYKEAKASGASESELNQLLQDMKSRNNAIRTELQFLINSKAGRLGNEEAQSFLMEKMDELNALRKSVPADDAEAVGNECVDQLKQWLKKTLAEVVNSSSDGSEMARLQSEKDKLIEKQQTALDNNNMSEFNRLQALIDAKDQDIQKLEQELTDIITSGDASDSEKTVAAAGLGSGTAASTALSIADSLVNDIQSGDFDGLENGLDSLEALLDSNSGVVTASLQNIKDALDGATSGELSKEEKEMFSDRLEDLIEEGTEKSNQNGLNVSEIEKTIEDVFGGPFISLTDDEKMVVTVAVEKYGEIQNNRKVKELAGSYADNMLNSDAPGAYKKLSTRVDEYVSTRALARVIGYRYVFDDAHTEVTLQRRKDFYTFTANSVRALTPEDDQIMSNKAEYQGDLYIPADYVFDTFEFEAEYVDKTSVALIYNEQQRKAIDEFYNILLQKGGM